MDELRALLQSGDASTVAELALALRVSTRTVTRDLNLLRERGLHIESSIGRGGGVRLDRHWSVGQAMLDYREALSLLLALALVEKLGSTFLLQGLNAIRNKLLVTFNPTEKQTVRNLRNRILVRTPASEPVRSGFAEPISALRGDAVQRAFFEMRLLRMRYRDGSGAQTSRLIEPQYLLMAWPVWYLLAWDHLRDDVRAFRLDRILSAEVDELRFKLRGKHIFETLIAEIGDPI